MRLCKKKNAAEIKKVTHAVETQQLEQAKHNGQPKKERKSQSQSKHRTLRKAHVFTKHTSRNGKAKDARPTTRQRGGTAQQSRQHSRAESTWRLDVLRARVGAPAGFGL